METSLLIGFDVNAPQSVRLLEEARALSLYIIGTPGTGKSTLLERLAIQDMHHGHGLCFLDPHEDSGRNLLKWVPEHRLGDVIFWDPTDKERPLGLNPFLCPNLGEVDSRAGIFLGALASLKEFALAFGNAPQMSIILLNLARTFLLNQGSTLAEATAFLEDEDYRQQYYPALLPHYESVLRFWRRYDRMPEREKPKYIASTMNKLERFETDRTMKTIFGQQTNSIDFRAAMDEGKIIIVTLSGSPKRLGPDNAAILGAFIVWELFQAALSRSEIETATRRRFHLYADEFQTFMTSTFPNIIDQGRKYGLDCVLAHQNRQGQLTEAAKASTLGIQNKIIFAVNSQDARELAWSFDTSSRETEQVPQLITEPQYEYYFPDGKTKEQIEKDAEQSQEYLKLAAEKAQFERERDALGIEQAIPYAQLAIIAWCFVRERHTPKDDAFHYNAFGQKVRDGGYGHSSLDKVLELGKGRWKSQSEEQQQIVSEWGLFSPDSGKYERRLVTEDELFYGAFYEMQLPAFDEPRVKAYVDALLEKQLNDALSYYKKHHSRKEVDNLYLFYDRSRFTEYAFGYLYRETPFGRVSYRFPPEFPTQAEYRLEQLVRGEVENLRQEVSGRVYIPQLPFQSTIAALAAPLLAEFRTFFAPLKARASYTASIYGAWEIAPFPEVVDWIAGKVQVIMEEIKKLDYARGEKYQHIKRLEKELEAVKARYVENQKQARYLGYDLPAKGTWQDKEGQRYRWVPGPQRSHDDMAHEIANQLIHLPHVKDLDGPQARCILAGKEYTVRTFEPPPAPRPDTKEWREARERLAGHIRGASQVRYGRDRAQVEAEIAQRLRGGSGRATIGPDGQPDPALSVPTPSAIPDVETSQDI